LRDPVNGSIHHSALIDVIVVAAIVVAIDVWAIFVHSGTIMMRRIATTTFFICVFRCCYFQRVLVCLFEPCCCSSSRYDLSPNVSCATSSFLFLSSMRRSPLLVAGLATEPIRIVRFVDLLVQYVPLRTYVRTGIYFDTRKHAHYHRTHHHHRHHHETRDMI
jgi:hypothetical protein